MEKKIKGIIFFNLTLCFFISLNCVKAEADESMIYAKAILNERHKHYKEIISKYGEIWIGYVVSEIRIPPGEYNRFLIEKANYYFKNGDNYILLGRIDKTGLYDKHGLCLAPAPTPPLISPNNQIIGINSNILEDSFLPTYILQSRIVKDRYIDTDFFVGIDIDTEQDTLRAFESIMF